MPEEWVGVDEASRRLNKSPSTIRRMIEAGQLTGERQIIGGSRERYLVRLPAEETPQDASETPQVGPSTSEPRDASAAPSDASAAIEGLLEELGAMRRQYEALRVEARDRSVSDAITIHDLRERVGRAEALVELLQAADERWRDEATRHLERAIRLEAERDELARELARRQQRPWWKVW